MIRRICVQWPNIGPYHAARLREASMFLRGRGIELIALETASRDALYEWERNKEDSFKRVTVFENRVFQEIAPRLMHNAVWQRLNEIQPDVVAIHTYSFPDSRACLAWCRQNRRGAVLMYDSTEEDARRIAWREKVKSILVKHYDAALVAGSPQARYLSKLGMPTAHMFRGYDVVDNLYYARRAAPGPPDKKSHPFFLTVSRLIPLKNLKLLLDAYSDYRERVDRPWNMVILGDGPDRSRLLQTISEHRLAGVTITGFIQVDELPSYYSAASAFIHPSLKDTWGLVVNEAMASGLPVIVSKKAGCHEDLVQEGINGFLFNPNDRATLAARMTYLTEHPDQCEQMGMESKKIIRHWDLDLFSRSLLEASECAVDVARCRKSILAGSALLRLLRLVTRRPESFHSAEN